MVDFTRLHESDEYVRRRDELRLAEMDLIAQRERVAGLRRGLPRGVVVDDYVFLEGPADLGAGDTPVREVRLSELFSAPDRPLVVYHLMFGKAQTTPCPMCTMWIDGINGVAPHIAQNADFVVVAAADPPALRAHARARGWDSVRLLSAGDNTFKYDLRSEDPDGTQDSTVSVFSRDPSGAVRHDYTAHPWMSDDVRERGIDLLCPTWDLLDLTPRGRGDWYAELTY
jgi:predicted dithiol-disulfide oxidoreductase (DUF899 family)